MVNKNYIHFQPLELPLSLYVGKLWFEEIFTQSLELYLVGYRGAIYLMELLQRKTRAIQNTSTNVQEVNWRKYLPKRTSPPDVPQTYFELPINLWEEKIFSYLESNNVEVKKIVQHLGRGKYCLDISWQSDFLKVLQRKNEIKYIREFICSTSKLFEVTLIHNHRRHSLSSRIGLRIKRL